MIFTWKEFPNECYEFENYSFEIPDTFSRGQRIEHRVQRPVSFILGSSVYMPHSVFALFMGILQVRNIIPIDDKRGHVVAYGLFSEIKVDASDHAYLLQYSQCSSIEGTHFIVHTDICHLNTKYLILNWSISFIKHLCKFCQLIFLSNNISIICILFCDIS